MEVSNFITNPDFVSGLVYFIIGWALLAFTIILSLKFLIKIKTMGRTLEAQTLKTQAEMIEWLKQSSIKHFKKFGTFTFEKVNEAQLVETFIDGKKETEKFIQPGDYILTGAKQERYGVDAKTFVKRYDVKQEAEDGSNGVATAKGEAWGFVYSGPNFEFTSPWKDAQGKETTMICEDGDTLVSSDAEISEVYRIEKEAFAATYKDA